MISIGELAKRTECGARVIRHYEQNRLLQPTLSANSYRQFDEAAVAHVRRIRVMLRNGFNLDEIRPVALMREPRPRKLICSDEIRLYQSKVDEIDRRIAKLNEVRDRARRRLQVITEQRNQGGPTERAAK